ncbi:MAG: hypothetical protein IJW63_08080 [Lachnospiraceae bacterium]|nr:hypothetical protein [Lachnospiraceae bacterium]
MSYLRAEDVLPKKLLETIQQYVNGQTIYIPSKEKQVWGSSTDTRQILQTRNEKIYKEYLGGISTIGLAEAYSLSVKSIQRIIREQKNSVHSNNANKLLSHSVTGKTSSK